MSQAYSEEDLRAAVERLSDPERFSEAERVVGAVAPQLGAVLESALGAGGWFGTSHESETLKAATDPDEDRRLEAVRSLIAEETRMGMMIGVAVGWALREELGAAGAADEDDPKSEKES